MAQASENVGCQMLEEFVVDASQTRGEPKPLSEPAKDEYVRELVRHIAHEMAVPQFNLGEIVEKVLAQVGPQIEERVRRELQEVRQRQEQSQGDHVHGRRL